MTELEKLIDALEYAQRMALGDVVIYREDINLILDTFDRLQEENERLIAECGNQSTLWSKHFESIFESAKETIKAEAYKEFAERLHCECQSIINQEWNKKVSPVSWADAYEEFDEKVDNIYKELVGEGNGKK